MTALPTIGVEEELAIVDRRTGRLAGRADEVLAELPDHLHGAVEHEMKRCQIELVSPVCTTLDEVATVLHGLRGAVARAAAGLDLAVAAGGTHPRGGWQHQEVTPKPAYRRLEEDYQRLADEQLVFGCHVHVCVDDPDRRIAALDRIRPWLATLLALTANSPFWEGEDTGYASYRYLVFSRWPTFGTPDPLGDWAGYEALVASLVESGAIDSASRLYWTARPSVRYPTIELRIADVATTVDEAVMLAGLARALVMTALDDLDAGRPLPEVRGEVLRAAEWQAARHGLTGDLLDPIAGDERTAIRAVAELLDHVGPALERTGDDAAVRAAVADVVRHGEGAARQRRAARAAGTPDGALGPLLLPTPTSAMIDVVGLVD